MSIDPFYYGVTSKIITTMILYPLNLIRTRYQQNQYINIDEPKYKNVGEIITKTWKNEGIRGFYKGIIPGLTRSLP